MREGSDAVARQTVPAEALLELAASGYERAQRDRIRYGEQLRAILQRRDARWGPIADDEDIGDPDAILREIRETGGGPVPLLGRLYAWAWLRTVRGIGSVLAARLLSRLDITRASSPASFWAYCGLGTVAAEEQVCEECGARVFVAPGTRVQAPHAMAGRRATCTGPLRPRGLAGTVRVAQARPRRGERAAYDLEAKTICYLIGVSFVRCGGPYRDVYDERKAHLARQHPEWPAKRVHLAAVRATVKRFLADLWVAWREAEGDGEGNPTAEAR
jgi:hypothetical protein